MRIDQRNAGASVTPTDAQYLVDRWFASLTQASKYTAQQNAASVTPPAGFSNYLGLTSSSAYAITSSDLFAVSQRIEGFNTADLAWGTANAATITLSFWVRSSLTGTFGGSIINSAGNYSYPFSYTISSANTWTSISVTIAGPTAGTWVGGTNGIGLRVTFGIGVGSSFSGTAGSWSANGYYSATGATSVVGTNGATFYITGVQLEKGTTATSFDYRPYGTELALCQRYFEKSYNNSVALATAVTAGTGQLFVNAIGGGGTVITVNFAVSKRASPTITSYDNAGTSGKNSYYVSSWANGGTMTVNGALEKGFNATLAGTGSLVYLNADWAATSEL
jgi:hypothetical protein